MYDFCTKLFYENFYMGILITTFYKCVLHLIVEDQWFINCGLRTPKIHAMVCGSSHRQLAMHYDNMIFLIKNCIKLV